MLRKDRIAGGWPQQLGVAYGPYYQHNQITWTLAAPLCPLTGWNLRDAHPLQRPSTLLHWPCTSVDSSVCFLLSHRPPESTILPRVALINLQHQPRWWRIRVDERSSRNETIFDRFPFPGTINRLFVFDTLSASIVCCVSKKEKRIYWDN